MIGGRCLCGNVRFEIDGRASSFWLCHCSKCRRGSGGPFATVVLCRANQFRFVSGESGVKQFESESGYRTAFCGNCGSPAPSPREGEESMAIALGTLDDSYEGRLVRHIFVGSKASWWEINDSAPQFDEHAF